MDDQCFFTKKVGAAIAVGGTRNGGQEFTLQTIVNFYNTQGMTICNGGSGVYSGAALWSPGDGSQTMEDEIGMENAGNLGKKMAVMTKIMKYTDVI